MSTTILFVFIGLAILLLAAVLIALKERQDVLEARHGLDQVRADLTLYRTTHQHTPNEVAAARDRSVKQSRSTLLGLIAEQLAPNLSPDLADLNPRDAYHVGGPLDLLYFDGLEEGEEVTVTLVFSDVKTGKSVLDPRQRRVRDAVQAGRVEWRTAHVEIELPPEVPDLPIITDRAAEPKELFFEPRAGAFVECDPPPGEPA